MIDNFPIVKKSNSASDNVLSVFAIDKIINVMLNEYLKLVFLFCILFFLFEKL